MIFDFENRLSDSPFVEAIWRTRSDSADSFISSAESRWEMVVTRQYGQLTLSVRGPETRATSAPIPADAEFFGIIFKLGTFMPHLPTIKRVNDAIHLPETSSRSFWFNSEAWEFPTFENADTFLSRLMRDGLLAQDSIVDAALQGHFKSPQELTLRSVQRRFLNATGLSHGAIRQIQRAQFARNLLTQGVSILDTIDRAGYADQPHLTRSLKRLIGQTPAQLLRLKPPE